MLKGYRSLTSQSFLNRFGNPILLYNGRTDLANSPMLVINRATIATKLLQAKWLNSKDSDIYFIPNGGGTRKTDITRLVTHFVDLDAGKDGQGRYLGLANVNRFKKKALAQVDKCPLKPSMIVETRNGYQLYWLLKQPIVNHISWNIVQNKICDYFKSVGADSKVLKANQILRVPGLYWKKVYTQLPQFLCSAWENRKTYTYNEVCTAFEKQSGNKPKCGVQSYTRPTVQHQSLPVKPNLNFTPQKVDSNLSEELADYLLEVGKILSYSGHKFLARQASVLQEKLLNQIAKG